MNRHILVVEDSPFQAAMVETDLLQAGYDVTVASSGEAAVELLGRTAFGLVLTDVVMPGMDGFALCGIIKGDPELAATPVVILTSLSDPLEVVRGLEAGADNFIRKPYQLDQLLSRIESIVVHRSLRTSGNVQMGVELSFLGQRFMITAERQQILDLLISSFEDLILTNRQLRTRESELARAREVLEASADKAMEATRLKSEFLARMSHEIRTPLNGVLGMVNVLLDTDLTDTQRDYAHTAQISGNALLGVINDVLDFSKIEAGKLDLEVLEFDLRRTVEDVADIIAPLAYAKSLELVTLVAPDVPAVVCGDPGRLRQVLLNLVGNAVKFTVEGEVVIRVGAQDGGVEGVVVRFDVEDTGPGMSAAQQEEVFDSFAQADASTTRRYGGTGLGLAISRQLVGLMSGEVGVESELGRGSRFWFTAKLGRGPAQEPTLVPDWAALAGVRALVVDDNAASRTALGQLLDEPHMRVSVADSAGAALAALHDAAHEGDPHAVAVIDFEMPGTDGLELARAIADDPQVGDSRIVLLTGSGHRGEARAAKHAGVAAYLTKPVHRQALYDCLAMLLGDDGEPSPPMVTRHTLAEAAAQERAHVLLAEDNAVNQKLAVLMLESLGYRVDVAANGFEAVQAIDRTPYAAILMDCQMPEMDGYEASRHIRARGTPYRVPIIALTAGATKEEEKKTKEAGMDAFLTKPVTKEVLADILNRWIR